jgi:hypothetical protein
MGVLIWASGKRYNSTIKPDDGDYAGVMAVTGYDEVTGHPSLELTIDPTKIIGNDQVVFKVDTRTDQVPPVLPAFDAPDVDFER